MDYTIEQLKQIQLTQSRLVVLRELRNGPRTWKDLKSAYYGSERAASKSHNSWQQQKDKLVNKIGIMKAEDGHYELTDLGRALLTICSEEELMKAKTKAQRDFELKKQNEGGDAQEAN